MKGDFSRSTFNPGKHYSGVRMQQGRVQTDADWNEQSDIAAHLGETAARDLIGASGAPGAHAGFAIGITSDANDLTISQGRMYVDGILCEADSVTTYLEQPDLPNPQAVRDILNSLNAAYGLVYLDVWKRHITALEDPTIREVALGGPDTCTRVETVWQVRIAPIAGAGPNYTTSYAEPGEVAETPLCDFANPEWDVINLNPARSLSARVQPTPPSTNACEILPRAGYQRLENQLYRVEVHQPGDLGTATFKWSRENGSVVTAWLGQDTNNLRVASTGRDANLGFATDDWIELTDDSRDLLGIPGIFVRINKVDGDVLIINPGAQTVNILDFTHNPKIRRWDSQGDVTMAVPANNDGYLALEGGIEIQFAGSGFRTGDYWLIPARTAMAATEIGGIEWPFTANGPTPLPPAGIQHHYARLAVIHMDANRAITVASDCRHIFPPLITIAGGIQVEDIRFVDGSALSNGSYATNFEVASGIRITCRWPLVEGDIRRSILCYVTLYTPFVFVEPPSLNIMVSGNPVGYQPVMLAGNAAIDPKDDTVLVWTPNPASAIFVAYWFNSFNHVVSQIPMRFSLKGAGPGGGELDFFFTMLEGSSVTGGQGIVQPGIGAHLV